MPLCQAGFWKFNLLKAEESRVILGKGTERGVCPANTRILEGPGQTVTSAGVATRCAANRLMMYPSASVVGSASTMRCGAPSWANVSTATVFAPKFFCNNCGGHLGHVFVGEGTHNQEHSASA